MLDQIDIDETGRNKYATGGIVSYDDAPIIRGQRRNTLLMDDYLGDELDHELLKRIITEVKKKNEN